MTPDGARVVISISGGKDSAAMALHLGELGIAFEPVFCDTGWEHPATYDYVRGPLEERFGPIRWLRSKRTMVEWVRHKQMFPSRLRRFCTEELKAIPIREHLKACIGEEAAGFGRQIVNAVGIRAAESASRGRMPEWERWGADGRGDLPVQIWRPIIAWTEADVIAIHKRHDMKPNPLYLRGASRVGCWPCIHARKSEIALVARETPERIVLIADMERELTASARARAESRALREWPADLDDDEAEIERQLRDPEHWRNARTFFGVGDKGRGWDSYDIHTTVEWAQTDRGGAQMMLLDTAADDGCMRWGLCETEQGET